MKTTAPTAATTSILVVDDHPLMLEATASALVAAGIPAVDRAQSMAQAQQRLAARSYSLVVLDLNLADARGLEGLLALRETYVDVPVIVFSSDDSPDSIVGALEHSARGYVVKSDPVEVLLSAVSMVLSGGTYIPPHVLRVLGIALPQSQPAGPAVARPARPHLSPRQEEVYRLLLQGMPNKVIARRLDMAEGTVKAHLSALYAALQVRNRAQAVLRGQQLGFI